MNNNEYKNQTSCNKAELIKLDVTTDEQVAIWDDETKAVSI